MGGGENIPIYCMLYLDDEYVSSEWLAESWVVVDEHSVDELKNIVLKRWVVCTCTKKEKQEYQCL